MQASGISLYPRAQAQLQLWGGVECTVNRVGDRYFDQLQFSGHAERLEDLDLFAQLGVKAIRYPVLWETTAPDGPATANWTWADERLGRLRELGIQPIVGLVHHGSGPRHTSLVEPSFAEGLAQFARAVAERYPWVEYFTPVNEPLTTARFSGLYGHWYPHGRDELTFARAVLVQCRAVSLAMRAIREVNPAAKLVQTEDLGKVYSTPELHYQADFENIRRWFSLDLLCGRVHPDHRMWHHMRWLGIPDGDLHWFLDNPCPPDIIGINHYITSERFLDHRLERYPHETHGSNGRHQYTDIEAVRVRAQGIGGAATLLNEAWERYQRPIAVTEAHLGCTREEQMRWFQEIWLAAEGLKESGGDIRAVTVWSLLGAYDWNSLLTRCAGHYEPGTFDLRGDVPRPTAIAKMVTTLGQGRDFDHPVLAEPGWWRRPNRLLYPAVEDESPAAKAPPRRVAARRAPSRPILITGATGTLGRAFARLCHMRGLPHHLLTRTDMDIASPDDVNRVLEEMQPWAVINAAGYVRVDDAEREAQACFRENTEGPALLAAACQQHNAAFLTFSSDLVFDGTNTNPYVESDGVSPLNVYGRSKAEAEKRVLAAMPSALVARTSAFFGPWDEHNFVTLALRSLAAGQPFIAAEDGVVSPTYVPDLVHGCLDLLIDGEHGLWHLSNLGPISWADFARQAATQAGFDAQLIEGRPMETLGFAAARPGYSALSSERAMILPPLDVALNCYFGDCSVGWN